MGTFRAVGERTDLPEGGSSKTALSFSPPTPCAAVSVMLSTLAPLSSCSPLPRHCERCLLQSWARLAARSGGAPSGARTPRRTAATHSLLHLGPAPSGARTRRRISARARGGPAAKRASTQPRPTASPRTRRGTSPSITAAHRANRASPARAGDKWRLSAPDQPGQGPRPNP
jgi:hypothetical protein